MKNILLIILIFFIHQNIFAQKIEFPVNKEHAIYEQNKYDIKIVQSTYTIIPDIGSGTISLLLKELIIELMNNKPGFVSVNFISSSKLIVEYQETLDQPTILKTINRKGVIFMKKASTTFSNE